MSQKWGVFKKRRLLAAIWLKSQQLFTYCAPWTSKVKPYVFQSWSTCLRRPWFFGGRFLQAQQQLSKSASWWQPVSLIFLGNHSQPDFQNPILCSSHFSAVKNWALLIVMSIHELFGWPFSLILSDKQRIGTRWVFWAPTSSVFFF